MFTDLNAIFRHNYSPAIVCRQFVIMECRKLQNYIFCFERREKVAEGQQVFHQRIFWGRGEGWIIFVQRLENYFLQLPIQTFYKEYYCKLQDIFWRYQSCAKEKNCGWYCRPTEKGFLHKRNLMFVKHSSSRMILAQTGDKLCWLLDKRKTF